MYKKGGMGVFGYVMASAGELTEQEAANAIEILESKKK